MANSYLRHPDNFFAGTRGLTLEQRGAYSDILDLYISTDGLLVDNETHISRCLAVDPRIWRRVRNELIALGKIEIRDSFVVPRGGDTTLGKSLAASEAGTKAAKTRWSNYRKNKETRDAMAMPYVKSSQVKTEKKESTPSPNGEAIEFNSFWDVYPKKVAKGGALKAYKSAIKRGATHEQLRSGAGRYAIACQQARTEKQFTKNPATWINQDCWLDEDGPPSGNRGNGQRASVIAAALAAVGRGTDEP